MPEPARTEFPPIDPRLALRVQARLYEYNTLRAEIIARMGTRFASLNVGATLTAAGIALAARGDVPWRLALGVLGALLSLLVGVWYFLGRYLGKASLYVQRVEREVNALLDDDAMTWEQQFGPDAKKSRSEPTQPAAGAADKAA